MKVIYERERFLGREALRTIEDRLLEIPRDDAELGAVIDVLFDFARLRRRDQAALLRRMQHVRRETRPGRS